MIYNPENNTMETARLLLRPFTPADAPAVSAICNSEAIHRGTLHLPFPYTVENALSWIAAHPGRFAEESFFDYAVTDRGTGALMGCVGLSGRNADGLGEIGYWMADACCGRGYMTEAVKAILKFAFSVKGYHKVYARHFATNPASGRVMEKAGMTREGYQKSHILKLGVYEDLILYGILNSRG